MPGRAGQSQWRPILPRTVERTSDSSRLRRPVTAPLRRHARIARRDRRFGGLRTVRAGARAAARQTGSAVSYLTSRSTTIERRVPMSLILNITRCRNAS